MEIEDIDILDWGYNLQTEILIGNLIAYKFSEYTHMINVRYTGGNSIQLHFIDVNAPYVKEVVDYVKNQLEALKNKT